FASPLLGKLNLFDLLRDVLHAINEGIPQEPNHWQVEAIRRNMEAHGLARTIRLDAFRVDPVAVIRHELLEDTERNREIRMNMRKVANGREKYVADELAEFLFNTRTYYSRTRCQMTE
ncbi:MAG: hypothetical protein JXA57_11305, partial [Armatimonadetes bacterium]|nr:hypothetical protein [Armatimonadota bacterium]